MKLSENIRSWAHAIRKCKTDEIADKLRDGVVFDGFADKSARLEATPRDTAEFVSRVEHVTIIKALASDTSGLWKASDAILSLFVKEIGVLTKEKLIAIRRLRAILDGLECRGLRRKRLKKT